VSDRETAGAELVGEGDGAPGNATREIFDAVDHSYQQRITPEALRLPKVIWFLAYYIC